MARLYCFFSIFYFLIVAPLLFAQNGDNCPGIILQCDTCVEGSTQKMNGDHECNYGQFGKDVVYQFILTQHKMIQLISEADYDADWSVARACNSLASDLLCSDCEGTHTDASCGTILHNSRGYLNWWKILPEGTYYVWVDGDHYDDAGNYSLELRCYDVDPCDEQKWEYMGPEGGYITAIERDPLNHNVLYAGTDRGGLYKSTDQGQSWIQKNESIEQVCVNAIAIDPSDTQHLIIGTRHGFFLSNDGGDTWSQDNMDFTIGEFTIGDPPSVAFSSYDSNILYAACCEDKMWKSTDAGQAWFRINNGIDSDASVRHLAINQLNHDILYIILGWNPGGVMKSTDGGANWYYARTGLHNAQYETIAIDPFHPNILYVGCHYCGLFKTTNGGKTWVPVSSLNANWVRSIRFDPNIPDTLYVGSEDMEDGIFKSTDNGISWIKLDTGHDPTWYQVSVHAIAIDRTDSQVVYAGMSKDYYSEIAWGIYKSCDAGDTWFKTNESLTNMYLIGIDYAINSPDILYTYPNKGDRIYKSEDRGVTWTEKMIPVDPVNHFFPIEVAPSNPDIVYVPLQSGLYKTEDGGDTWVVLSPPTNFFTRLAVDAHNPEVVYGGSHMYNHEGLYKSTDGGKSWVLTSMTTEIWDFDIGYDNPDYIYVRANDGYYRSTDGGNKWTFLSEMSSGGNLFVVDPNDAKIVYKYGGAHYVFKSLDAGDSWIRLQIVPFFGKAITLGITPGDSQVLYTCTTINEYTTEFSYFYKSIDGGYNWIPIGYGFDNAHVLDLAVLPGSAPEILISTEGAGIMKYGPLVTVPVLGRGLIGPGLMLFVFTIIVATRKGSSRKRRSRPERSRG